MDGARRELIAGLVTAAAGAALFVATPFYADTSEGEVLTPASFPLALSALIAVLGLVLAAGAWRRMTRGAAPAPAAPGGSEDEGGDAGRRGVVQVALALLVMALYAAAISWLGYIAATALALLALAAVYGGVRAGGRSWRGILAVAVLVPPALFFFFEKVMVILLPQGRLF